MSGRTFLVIAAMLVSDPSAFARRPPRTPPKTPIDEFERMSPEQRQRALNRLPPAQRTKLEERLQRFHQLPPEQQGALRNLYNRLHELPPNQQESVRKAINRFSDQAPNRQRAMREELRSMAALPAPDRDAHMASREFRQSFSRREQGIVRDMLPLLPSR
jgi:hypothetical protein